MSSDNNVTGLTTEQVEKGKYLMSQDSIRRFIGDHTMNAFISFVFLLIVIFVALVLGDPFITDMTSILFIGILAIFIHGVLVDGQIERDRRASKTGPNQPERRVKLPDNLKRSGMFGWMSALNCETLTDEDKKAQCEFDGSTLYQQLGDFERWVNTDKSGRTIYSKDYKRLREDKCNLFGREDLQTSCKLNKLKY